MPTFMATARGSPGPFPPSDHPGREALEVVTVVIPVLNAEAVLGECLDAIAAQRDVSWEIEIVVIDNGSTDRSAALAAEHRAAPRVIGESQRGPYAARNAGIATSRGEIIAFTDADCIPDPEWLHAGAEAIRNGLDLAGGAIVQRRSARATAWERYDRAMYLQQEEYVTMQGFAATANLFVRRKVFDRIGTFVPELVASGDVELGRRARAAGFRLGYAPEARVEHRPRTTLQETWALHRKLGSGFAELARYGVRGSAWKDRALRIPLGSVINALASDGPTMRRRNIAHVHLIAMIARWVGRLTGRG
jgi:glycosyltransferase AglI